MKIPPDAIAMSKAATPKGYRRGSSHAVNFGRDLF